MAGGANRPDFPAGAVPSRYNPVETIARGGMSIVLKVIDREDGETRALKLLPITGCTPTAIELFRLEFARLSALAHPGIVKVYDFGVAGDQAVYFVMEYLNALHFDEALRSEPPDRIISAGIQLCDALSYVHSRGVVHGDIKPGNVLVAEREDGVPPGAAKFSVKLTDFGLSRMMREVGMAGGTYAYAAPEVIRGEAVDARADLYSLGAMLYEVLTGSRLFPETSGEAILRAHLLKRPVSPREINPSLPNSLSNIVLRLLEKDRGLRYQSARDLSSVLAQAGGFKAELESISPEQVSLLRPAMIGREKERSVLKQGLDSCRTEGGGSFFLVSGEAGIGKSRLLEWLRLSASIDNFRVASCAVSERSSAGQMHFSWSGRAGNSFQPSDLLSGSIFPGAGDKLEPTIVLLDDIHTGGEELLRDLAARVPQCEVLPLLVVCSCDSESFEKAGSTEKAYEELRSLGGVREIHLNRLSLQETLALASSMLAVEPSDELGQLASWVFSRSNGIPMIAEELLTELESRGLLKRTGERVTWSLPREESILSGVGTPELLERRISSLSEKERLLLEAASVSGNSFRIEALDFVLKKPIQEVALLIKKVRDLGLIQPGEPGFYVFSHPLTRSILYRDIDTKTKIELHRRTAQWLEERMPDTALTEIAVHLEESGQKKKALECRIKCLELSMAEASLAEAFAHGQAAVSLGRKLSAGAPLKRALELTAECAERAGKHSRALELWKECSSFTAVDSRAERLKLDLKIARLNMKLSHYSEAEEELSEALTLASGEGLEKDRAEILTDMSWIYNRTSRDGEALKLLGEAMKLVSGLGTEALLAQIENRSGVILSRLGRLDESEKRHREAVRLARLSGKPEVMAPCLNNLGLLLVKRGRLEEAEAAGTEACERAKEAGEVLLLSSCYNNLGVVRRELLKFDSALDSYMRSMELRKRCGDLVGSGKTAANVAVIYRLKGEMQLALHFYGESYRMAGQFGLVPERAMAAGNLGEIEGLKGNVEDSEKMFAEAMDISKKSGDNDGYSFFASGLGYVYLRNREPDKALRLAQEFLEVSSEGSQERCVGEQLLVETLCYLGRVEEAREALKTLFAHTDERVLSVGLGILRRMEGLVLEKGEDLREAIERYRSSCKVLSGEGDALERARSLLLLGEALLSYRRESGPAQSPQIRDALLTEAISSLEEADQIFERMEANPERSRSMSNLLHAYRDASLSPGATAQREEIDTLFKAAELINSTLPSSIVLDKIMDLALEKTRAERGLIVLANKETGEIEKVLSRALEDENEKDALEISRTVVRRVTRGGQALATQDACSDPDLKDIRSVARLEIRSILCVPLKARTKVIGAVYLDNRTMPGAFGPAHQSFMEGFANLAGMAIENSMLREELEGKNEYLNRENLELRNQVASRYRFDQIIGKSPQMKKVFNAIEKVAESSATVLIAGASGTGKELVARAIHSNSPRKEKPFIPVNCASIPRELIEGELFGIEDRVATGVSKRIGVFEQADGGSIFLDEIGDMSPDLQAKLLRVLQEREFTRVGGRRSIKVDVRIICATNKNLLNEITRGVFRPDLYYRISGIPIDIPPLRERRADIPLLVDFFLKRYSALHKRARLPKISNEIMQMLVEGDWEGNVRELENCVERFVIMSAPGEEVTPSLLPPDLKMRALSTASASDQFKSGKKMLREEVEQMEKKRIMEAIVRNKGNRSKVGRELGISEQSVRYKIRKYGINVRQLCREGLT